MLRVLTWKNSKMENNQKLPIKHHYIPQFYLKGFSQDQEHLHVFDKKAETDETRFRYQTTQAIAYKKNFYTYETQDQSKETLEGMFSQIEGVAQQAIQKLSHGEQLDKELRSYLALFIAFLWVRVPQFKAETLGAQEELHEKMARMMFRVQPKKMMRKWAEKEGKEMTDEEIDDLIDFATNPKRSKIKMDFPQNYWIKQMLELGDHFYPYLAITDWQIVHSPTKYGFLTSDNPFILMPSEKPHPFYGVGLLTPGVKKIIPLRSDLLLIMHEPSDNPDLYHTQGTKEGFRLINEQTVLNAERVIFSPDLGKIQKIAKTKPHLVIPRGKRYRVS